MTFYPTFDTNALSKLAERTEYEMWLLEAVYAIVEQELFPSYPDAVVYSLGKSKAQHYGYMRGSIVIGDWRPGFLNAGAPLVFVSIFKLLDMLIERVLEKNGKKSPFQFQEKLKQLTSAPKFPNEIETRPWLKDRLVGLYRTLDPLRGTIIHDKTFKSMDGAIQISASRKGTSPSPVNISAAQLRTLAIAVVSVLKYIDGTWQLNDLREKILRHELDELVTLHGLPVLGQKRPFHTQVRVYLEGSDPLDVDPVAIRSDLCGKYLEQDCSFDLRVLMVKSGKVVEAYFFPWAVVSVANSGVWQKINAKDYRADIPDDINPDHIADSTS